MKVLDLVSGLFALCLALTVLAGCGGNVLPERFDGSWMAPEAKSSDLLYVEDSETSTVSVFSYPQAKLVGKLAHFKLPDGICVDGSGDVYITDNRARTRQIWEYRHGRSSPIRILTERSQSVIKCAVDLKTGDLAVTSMKKLTDGPGVVAIYPKAQGPPTYYIDKSIQTITYCGYDSDDNLFVDAWDNKGNFILEELPRGGSAFVHVRLNHRIEGPGGIQALGKDIVIGDIDNSVVYQFHVTANRGKRVSTTRLALSGNIQGFWLLSHTIIAQEFYDNDSVGVWDYPKGGRATSSISGFRFPVGVAISRAR